ncbi:MAG: type II secretion system F family protein [Actinomycetaceae bacterium]|nr:type II secretion system F family protein [Actinomycetaceae bacterium]
MIGQLGNTQIIGPIIAGMLVSTGIVIIGWAVIYRPSRLLRRVSNHIAAREVESRSRFPQRLAQLATTFVERIGSTRQSVERRLAMLGEETVAAFRMTQLQWAAGGAAAGIVLGIALVTRGMAPVSVLVTVGAGAVSGALAADSYLTRQAAKESAAYTRQLPDVIEILALAVGSGEPIRVALERVCQRGEGELIVQLQRTLDAIHAGTSMPQALTDLAKRCDNRNVARFADSIIAALEQGSGLSGTLYAQSRDARDAARRELMEQGGKAEISMMIPVIFLILPVTVMFTLFPALASLRLT